MRNLYVLLGCTALAACGGGEGQGPTSPGGVSVSGGSSSSGSTTALLAQSTTRTYVGVGGDQVFTYSTDDRVAQGQQAQTFAGAVSTVRNSAISITYEPGNATFTLSVPDANTGAVASTRFQDPASRTNFGGSIEPQWGTPNLASVPGVAAGNVHYLQAGDGSPLSPYIRSGTGYLTPGTNSTPADGDVGAAYQSATLFYQVPGTANAAGTTTNYVSFAGYVRNAVSFSQATIGGATHTVDNWQLERGAFAFGDLTSQSAVPKSGTGTYQGGMVATMVMNPTLDGNYGTALPTYFQWIYGTSNVSVNFGTGAVNVGVQGVVLDPQIDRYTGPALSTIAQGTSFTASGSATIDLVGKGGFDGTMTSASFGATTNGAPTSVTIGGSALNGAFYGPGGSPDKVEVGGGFHIAGGVPDQRIDIIGGFAGARTGN